MADNNTVARPYAQAIFAVASESGDLATWAAALDVARQVLADGQVVEYLGDPKFSDTQRYAFLTGLFSQAGAEVLGGKDKKGSNFLKLLLEYRRVNVLPEIAEHFAALKANVENSVDATVTSAVALSKAQIDTIAKALNKRLGRDVKITTKIDEDLIGGAVIRAGDVVIDGSLRARLAGLATALTK
ncbi:MAG: F0F1 ATP synthase subunit delta [Gammaproteobacteria bacterium]|nr:F0F1 ATP synthase subunit delta [Gammaproteobacteria bacterium]